jgi:hypothetical protein
VALEPQPVAQFYGELTAVLPELGIPAGARPLTPLPGPAAQNAVEARSSLAVHHGGDDALGNGLRVLALRQPWGAARKGPFGQAGLRVRGANVQDPDPWRRSSRLSALP